MHFYDGDNGDIGVLNLFCCVVGAKVESADGVRTVPHDTNAGVLVVNVQMVDNVVDESEDDVPVVRAVV